MDDPRKGACSFSEDTTNSDSNLLYQFQIHKQTKQKIGHIHRLPSGNKASTTHLHFPFQNGSISQCESYMRDEGGVGQPLEKKIEHFMDDPRKGACNFSENTAKSDSNLLYQFQSHEQMKQKMGHVHQMPSGNKASPTHLHFPLFLL